MTAADSLTPAEVEEARQFIGRWIDANTADYPHPVGSYYKLLARYARLLEQHAEAMARQLEFEHEIFGLHGESIKALTAYRQTFPRGETNDR